MQTFKQIYERAQRRKGDPELIHQALPRVLSSKQLAQLTDDRYLAEMTRCIFQAGFVWRVVNNKWAAFEAAFFNFAPEKMVWLSPDQLERIGSNPEIIRNMQKVLTVPHNAQFILDMQKEHGSFSEMIAQWPSSEIVEIFDLFKKRGKRLGGNTGPRVLRNLGVDTFILSGDVIRCLAEAGVELSKTASSKRDLSKVQNAFNEWQQETGLPMAHLSRIASMSVGENYSLEQINRHETE